MFDKLPPITSKAQMYDLLARGDLGNTIRQFFSVEEWLASDDWHQYPVWGVRTMMPGGPCRLYCPRDEVTATAAGFAPHPICISIMLESVRRVTLMAEIFVGYCGLELYAIEGPPVGCNWREAMPSQGKTYRFLAARGVLGRNLTPSDQSDLEELMTLYPDHVIEFSAVDRPIGIYPHRKMIVWEVRTMSGEYEKPSWKHNDFRSHATAHPLQGG